MKKTITNLAVLIFIITTTPTRAEELLGQYHFNDATTYWEVSEVNSIVMNTYTANAKWVISINDGSTGVYKAINGVSPVATNINQYPMGLNIEPRPGYAVKISKIQLAYKAIFSGDGASHKFSYSINAADVVSGAVDIIPTDTFTDGIAEGFVGVNFTFTEPLTITGSKFWFYNRIKSIAGFTSSTEVDFIKFFGTSLDPNEPVINVPINEQSAKAAPLGGSSWNVIDITHNNLSEIITASSSSEAFSASFDDSEDGTYKKLRVTYHPTMVGYESANITLTSGTASSTLKVKGWGLPENVIAAWNFNEKTTIPDYYSNTDTIPSIELIGGSGSEYFLKNSWMYEINNLYKTNDGNEIPEIAGIKFNNLGFTGKATITFDIQSRNGSPNTMKIGTYNENDLTWLSGVYWRNPNEVVAVVTNVVINFDIVDSVFSIVSAYDQTIEPKAFKTINPTTTFNNTNGWAFDNLLIMPQVPQSVDKVESDKDNISLFAIHGMLQVKKNTGTANIEIFNLNGMLVKTAHISGDAQIPVNLKGVYIVRLRNDRTTVYRKILF